MKKEIVEMINDQINLELYSGYLYIEIANYYEYEGLDGYANWFFVQAKEEFEHANLFRTFLLNKEHKVVLSALENPTTDFKNYLEPLKAAFEHELLITESINKIYAEAEKAGEYRTKPILNWFVMEQNEEEKNTSDLITKYELFGDDAKSLYMLNQEYAARTFVPVTVTFE